MYAWKQTKTNLICKIIDRRHVFVDFTYFSDLLNARFEQTTRVFGDSCKDARPKTTLTNQLTMQVPQNDAEKISKHKKVLINLQGKERHLCEETNTTAQAQETQNDSTATLCSGFFMSKRVLAEGANKLTQEEIAMLEFDIFKPLDFNEILFNRMKSGDYQGRIITNLSEL